MRGARRRGRVHGAAGPCAGDLGAAARRDRGHAAPTRGKTRIFVKGGFAEVDADRLTVLAERAIAVEAMDAADDRRRAGDRRGRARRRHRRRRPPRRRLRGRAAARVAAVEQGSALPVRHVGQPGLSHRGGHEVEPPSGSWSHKTTARDRALLPSEPIAPACDASPDRLLERFPVDMRRNSPHTPAWRPNRSLSSYVIPAPLARAAGERDQAGTHAPGSLLSDRMVGTTAPRLPGGTKTRGGSCFEVHGSRPVPAWALQAQAAPG